MVQLAVSVLRLSAPALLVAAVALAGCALKDSADAHRGRRAGVARRDAHSPAWRADPAGGEVTNGWLKSFDDPVLEGIVAEAIANNLDLKAAATKVAIAQQTVIVVGSRLLPWVGVQLGATGTKDFDDGTFGSTSAFLGVAWELDVWGRLRAQRAASEANAEAVALRHAYARQSLAATTAKLWYARRRSAPIPGASAKRAFGIYGESAGTGAVSPQRRQGLRPRRRRRCARKLEQAQSDVERARESYGEARRALEVLLGRYPAAGSMVAAVYPPLPPFAAPACRRHCSNDGRGNLIAAEREVLAAFRREEAAQLALLPDFSLSVAGGRLGDQALSLLHLNPWLASAGIGVSIPIYTGGALQAKVVIATAQQSEAVTRYGAVALTAFREVENSLSNERLLALQLPLDQKSLQDRTEAVRIATIQYKSGRRDLLWVAQLQTAQLASEANLIKLRGAQRTNRVRLYQVLGGSFDAAPAATVSAR
jgi:outer membrane protein TolC